jgi:hypothetical protein
MNFQIENKSAHEWNAIQDVYKKNTHTIIGIDRPDFSVTRIQDQYCIGVEVTRFYFHEASARLKNKANYAEDVLSGKVIPADKKFLTVDQIELLHRKDTEGNPLVFDGVLYNHPQIQDTLFMFSKDISKKNDKYQRIDGRFRKTELIITDEENCFGGFEKNEFNSSIYSSDVLNSVIQFSLFSELYLITNLFGSRTVFPLKRALFLNRLLLICSYYQTSFIKNRPITIPFALFLFKTIKALGYLTIKAFKDNENSCYVIYETCLIKITDFKVGFRTIDYDEDLDKLSPVNLDNDIISKSEFNFIDFFEYLKKNVTDLTNFILKPLSS